MPARFQTLPRIEVRRELFVERDDDVAGLPSNAGGDRSDAFRSILDDGDLGRGRVDQPRGRDADALIGFHPLLVMLAAELESVLREMLHGFGGAAGRAGRQRHGSDRRDVP